MKVLTVLILVQIGLLLLVFGKIVTIEKEMTVAAPAERNTLPSDDLGTTQPQSNSSDTYIYLDEDQLRRVIREELRAHLDNQPGLGNQEESATLLSLSDTAEYDRRRELVAQQLFYFSSVGSISNADMQLLQGDIAKLDEASRKEMLRKLTQALNSGKLEGRL